MSRGILALDQGTTGSAAVVVDDEGRICASADLELRQHFPAPGWVEHDPLNIWESTLEVGRAALAAAPVDVAAIGLTNQRETTIVWEAATGTPIYPAVVWQSRASAEICESLKAAGHEPLFAARTGLRLDAYFSGTKLRWILDRVPGAQARAEAGELRFGTVDSWLVWQLTSGRVHCTDVANAARTLLFDIHRLTWDDELLALLDLPRALLPTVRGNAELYGETDPRWFGRSLPIAGSAGDQQAALFGQACYRPGEAKNTYGTGNFLLVTTGSHPHCSTHGLLTTVAWQLAGTTTYALEGSAFVTGAAVQWLRDGLGVLRSAGESEALAASISTTGGVYLVPAFTGLGAPHWDMYARGLIIGITRGTGRAEVVRATLESIAYQSRDLAEAMAGAGQPIDVLNVDGGATANAFLMQFQADLLGVPVDVAAEPETTALGAAYFAGLTIGLWSDLAQLRQQRRSQRQYLPRMGADERESLYAGWLRAVDRARGWATESR